VSTAAASHPHDCDDFRVEAPYGSIGRVEETWLGPDQEPAGFVVRLLDGRRGLVLADAVRAILPGNEEILLDEDAAVRALSPPLVEHAARTDEIVSASWTTTGELVTPLPASPGPEAPIAKVAVTIVIGLTLLVALEITLAFSIAHLVTGHAY
jgi:hypothetical protein